MAIYENPDRGKLIKGNAIPLYEFRLHTLTDFDYPDGMIIGVKRSAKTTLMNTLCCYYSSLGHEILIINATRDKKGYRDDFKQMPLSDPKTYAFLNDLTDPKKNGYIGKLPLILVFDDCSGHWRELSNLPDYETIFIANRHLNVAVFSVQHDLKTMQKAGRESADLIFITKVREEDTMKNIYKLTRPSCSFDDFIKFLDDNTKNFNKLLFVAPYLEWQLITGRRNINMNKK